MIAPDLPLLPTTGPSFSNDLEFSVWSKLGILHYEERSDGGSFYPMAPYSLFWE